MRKSLKNLAVSLVMVGALFCVTINAVRAQNVDMSQMLKIPSFLGEMKREEFYANSVVYEEEFENDKKLSYKLRLPEHWKKVEDLSEAVIPNRYDIQAGAVSRRLSGEDDEAPARSRVFKKVASYYGSNHKDIGSRFEIIALSLEHGIAARNWFYQYILDNGYILQGMKEHDSKHVEGLYVMVEGEFSYYVRTVVEVHGSRLMMASYYLPEKYWEEERALQEWVIKEFEFTAPRDEALELSQAYNFFDMVYFNYPSAWRMTSPTVYSAEAMDATLLYTEDQQTLSGELNIHIVSTELDTTLAQEVQYLKEDMKDAGLKIGNLIDEPSNYDLHNHIYFDRIEVYKANDEQGTLVDYEFWFAVMAESRYYYLVTMLTPGRDNDFMTWARNIEAFETLIESIRPYEEMQN